MSFLTIEVVYQKKNYSRKVAITLFLLVVPLIILAVWALKI